MNVLTSAALDIAIEEIGVHEQGGNNRGARVEEYQAAAGAKPGDPWCASFVYWCFERAARAPGVPNPLPRTPGVLSMWHRSPAPAQRKSPTAGALFVQDKGHGLGHIGFVEGVGPDLIYTVEGNTNDGGSREGDAVMRRSRPRGTVMGYLNFGEEA